MFPKTPPCGFIHNYSRHIANYRLHLQNALFLNEIKIPFFSDIMCLKLTEVIRILPVNLIVTTRPIFNVILTFQSYIFIQKVLHLIRSILNKNDSNFNAIFCFSNSILIKPKTPISQYFENELLFILLFSISSKVKIRKENNLDSTLM